MNEEIILSEYLEGNTVTTIARKYKCRNSKIVRILESKGYKPSVLRGMRLGKQQEGVPKAYIRKYGGIPGNPSNSEWAYIAGIFDGEGCIGVTKLHEWLQNKLECGKIRTGSPNNGRHFIFRLDGQLRVYDFLKGVLPFLIVKKQKAIDALNIMEQKYGFEQNKIEGTE